VCQSDYLLASSQCFTNSHRSEVVAYRSIRQESPRQAPRSARVEAKVRHRHKPLAVVDDQPAMVALPFS
jgi:hypothetical protein